VNTKIVAGINMYFKIISNKETFSREKGIQTIKLNAIEIIAKR
jgi:hypothetical protein